MRWLDLQSGGTWALQHHDEKAPSGVEYTEVTRIMNFASRVEYVRSTEGLTWLNNAPKTLGPVGGWVCVPADEKSTRTHAQWGAVFPVKVEDPPQVKDGKVVKPGKFRPVYGADADGWKLNDSETGKLGTIEAWGSDASAYPSGTPGLVVATTRLGKQELVFFAAGGNLVAPYRGGKKEDGSLVYDVDPDTKELDKERKAHLQSFWRVYETPAASFGLFGEPGTHGLAFQLGRVRKDGTFAGLGVLADQPLGSNSTSADTQAFTVLSYRGAGPMHPGFGPADKHYHGSSPDGDFCAGHLSTETYFAQSSRNDAPLDFNGPEYPKKFESFTNHVRVWCSYDPDSFHSFGNGTRPGLWRWWTDVPYITPGGGGGYDDGGGDPVTPPPPPPPPPPIKWPGWPDWPPPPHWPPPPDRPDRPRIPRRPDDPGGGIPRRPTDPEWPPVGGPITEQERKTGQGYSYNPGNAINLQPWFRGGMVDPAAPVRTGVGGSVDPVYGRDYGLDLQGMRTIGTRGEGVGAVPEELIPRRQAPKNLGSLGFWQEIAAPAFAFQPTHYQIGQPDLRNNPRPTRAQLDALGEIPIALRLEVVGAQDGNSWTYVERPRQGRNRTGSTNGALWILASNVGIEQHNDNLLPTTRATAKLGISNDARFVFGTPLTTGKTGSGVEVYLSGGELKVDTTNSVGTVTATDTLWPATAGASTETPGWAGCGGDGAFDLDGTNTYSSFFSKSGSTYTQIADVAATTFVVQSGVTVLTKSYRIYAKTSFTNGGTMSNNGSAGDASALGLGGTGATGGSCAGVGGNGGTAGSNGSIGTPNTSCIGGNGGNGTNAGSGGSAGTGGNGSGSFNNVRGTYRHYMVASTGLFMGGSPGSNSPVGPGCGGGGGSSLAATKSGGGGGGGVMVVVSPTITNTGTMQCNGGNGGSVGTDDGGGGGGGGVIFLVYRTYTNSGTVQAVGGTKGSASATNGSDGKVVECTIS